MDDRPSPALALGPGAASSTESPIKITKTYIQLEDERKLKNELRNHPVQEEKMSSKSVCRILGDLPSLQNDRTPKSMGSSDTTSYDINRALDYGSGGSEFPRPSKGPASPTGNKTYNLDSRADGKDANNKYSNGAIGSNGKVKSKRKDPYTLPPGFPTSFLCQLSQRPMIDPVKSIYGNVFDRPVILRWMGMQGHICPLSGKYF